MELKLSERGFRKYCKDKKIICFGAGIMCKDAIEYLGIAEQVLFVLDNDPHKQNTFVNVSGKSYKIYSVTDMPSPEDGTVLLITSKFFSDIAAQVQEADSIKKLELAIYPLLKQYTPRDKQEYYEVRVIDSAMKIYREFCIGKKMDDLEIQNRLQFFQKQIMMPDINGKIPFVMPRLVYIMSSVCNLNCRHCLALMPLYQNPSHVDVEILLRDIRKTLGSIDICAGIELIGGETFLYPELTSALKLILDNQKVFSVILSTNGTVFPSPELIEQLKHPKIWIRISDYSISSKVRQVANHLSKAGIRYDLINTPEWKDGGGTDYRGKSTKTIEEEFFNCENARVSKTIYKGKVFICPRSARLYSLGLYDSEQDYVDLRDDDDKSETQRKLLEMQLRDRADACQYCDFGSLTPRPIPAGEQVEAKNDSH